MCTTNRHTIVSDLLKNRLEVTETAETSHARQGPLTHDSKQSLKTRTTEATHDSRQSLKTRTTEATHDSRQSMKTRTTEATHDSRQSLKTRTTEATHDSRQSLKTRTTEALHNSRQSLNHTTVDTVLRHGDQQRPCTAVDSLKTRRKPRTTVESEDTINGGLAQQSEDTSSCCLSDTKWLLATWSNL